MNPVSAAAVAGQVSAVRAWADSVLRRLSVAVVYGGVSAEDQMYISKSPADQLSVTALSETLDRLGVRYQVLDPCQPSFVRDAARFDVVLPNLHGPFGEDGRLQGLLDYLRVPYCGSGVAASAIAADKILCKRHMEALGVPTAAWRTWPGPADAWAGRPVMVKARMGGSSVGMSLVRQPEDLVGAISRAESADPPGVLIEDHVPGLPVTVGVLELPGGIAVFPPLATEVHGAEFYDADAKLGAAGAGTVTSARAALPAPVIDAVNGHVVKLWDGLGCHGMARVDFIAAQDGTVAALEVNTTPGMSAGSNFVTGAGLLGLTHADILLAILREALARPRYDAPLSAPDFSGRPM
jgi:D-alanine-D-alanine ligase